MDATLNDLPKNQADSLRDTTATRKLFEMGQKWSGDGSKWVEAAKQSSARNGIPMYYIVNKIRQENSSFDPTLKSSDPKSSATGLGQFVKGTAQHLHINPEDPIESIIGIGDYMGELKKQGNHTYEDISKAYTLGPGGYKKFQQGQHVAGEQYMPSIDKFLAANNLKNDTVNVGQAEQLPIQNTPTDGNHMMEEVSTSGLQLQDPREMQQFLAHPRRELEEQQNLQHLAELKQQRDQIMQSPYHNIEDLADLRTI